MPSIIRDTFYETASAERRAADGSSSRIYAPRKAYLPSSLPAAIDHGDASSFYDAPPAVPSLVAMACRQVERVAACE